MQCYPPILGPDRHCMYFQYSVCVCCLTMVTCFSAFSLIPNCGLVHSYLPRTLLSCHFTYCACSPLTLGAWGNYPCYPTTLLVELMIITNTLLAAFNLHIHSKHFQYSICVCCLTMVTCFSAFFLLPNCGLVHSYLPSR